MLNFTKGPWTCHSGIVYNEARDTVIALMDRSEKRTTPVERDANAKLISLAPEMFDALKNVASTLANLPDITLDAPSNFVGRDERGRDIPVQAQLRIEHSRIKRLIDNMECNCDLR